MRNSLTPNEFIDRWKGTNLKERSAYQSHFNDICRLIGHQTPTEMDPDGDRFCFEKGASKTSGGDGWADVWYKGHFAWEYKGRHANLEKAYQQVLQYRDDLENPPLMIVCDLENIIIRTSFTNTPTKTYKISIDDLKDPEKLAVLKNAFFSPDALRPGTTVDVVTEEAAEKFSILAERLRVRGYDPEMVARFLIRLLFCLFAEDVGILPKNLISDLVTSTRTKPIGFVQLLRELFSKMETGGWFGRDEIPHIDGHLFEGDLIIQLEPDEMRILQQVSQLDWGSLSPAILGTLFERSLDPNKRAQLGAHYTSESDILLIVEPVVIQPLRLKWTVVREKAEKLAKQRDEAKTTKTKKPIEAVLRDLLIGFSAEIAGVRVLDPACGSGNFLYVSLRELLNLEKEVVTFAGTLGVGRFFPTVTPAQLNGIEINEYAYQLAQATIQVGYLQWLVSNGFGYPTDPVLRPLDNIHHMDAVMRYENGQPCEPEWPEADVIVGNPPFLGDKKMRRQLGDQYVEDLRKLYKGKVPGGADFVTYWFERARALIEAGKVNRAGLLATNSIRNGVSRQVIENIQKSGGIFMAWSDRPWMLDGAAVRVSMIGFDDGTETERYLDGKRADRINPDLSARVDITKAKQLSENAGTCFLGVMKGGPFDIDGVIARRILKEPINPNGRPNSDVVKRRMSGQDVTDRPRDVWVIDFVNMLENEANLYEAPFDYVRKVVKPIRDQNKDKGMRNRWWIHGRSRPEMRAALRGLSRCIITPEVAKWRIFIWMDTNVIPDHKLHVFARDDDYFFGVLHSRVHEVWSLNMGSTLEDRPSYSSSRTFETFPLPWPPGQEPKDAPRVMAIADAAKELDRLRNAWLNPPGTPESQLLDRTMTALYNKRPGWLADAHAALDKAVFAAYGWPAADISDDEILGRLMELNRRRATA